MRLSWKPAAAWLPSQNGLFKDRPHRQSVIRLRTSYRPPSAAVTGIRPRIHSGPATPSAGSQTTPIDGGRSGSNGIRVRRSHAWRRPDGQSPAWRPTSSSVPGTSARFQIWPFASQNRA